MFHTVHTTLNHNNLLPKMGIGIILFLIISEFANTSNVP
jgi:hypothetical protein